MNKTPCEAENSDDWFLDKSGVQYDDDPPFVTFEEAQEVADERGTPDDVDVIFLDLDRERRLKALQRRRHAKDACYTCPVRTQCLDLALEQRPAHGTWGGYYEEELRKLYRAIDARRLRGAGVGA